MKIIQTDYQENLAKLPTHLDLKRELFKREGLDTQQLMKLYQLELEDENINNLLTIIQQESHKDWLALRDIWFATEIGPIKCDLLLITQKKICTFMVGLPRSPKSDCETIMTVEVPHMLYNVASTLDYLSEIFTQSPHDIKVQSLLVWAEADSLMDVKSSSPALKVINRCEMKGTIRRMRRAEAKSAAPLLDIPEFLELIEAHEAPNPHEPTPIPWEQLASIRPGICCAQCFNFNINIEQHYIACDCGVRESLEVAIVRTICEYGVLHFTEYLDALDIIDFFAGQISPLSITEVLYKYFDKIPV